MLNKFIFPINPQPKVRMTQKSKWSAGAKKCLEYQNQIAELAVWLKVPPLQKRLIQFDKLHFYRCGRACDVDNLVKSFFDGLQYANTFENDNQIRKIKDLEIIYTKEPSMARIEFIIKPYENE